MLKSCILKLRIWTDRYWHGNVHNSLFKQCLSQPATQWHVTSHNTFATSLACATCPSFVTLVWVRVDTPAALVCPATQISPALKHVSDSRMQKYKLLVLLGTCCPHPFKVFLCHVRNFFRLLKKCRILSWEVLCIYPSPRQTFGKCTCLLSKYQISFEVCGQKIMLYSWLFPAKEP